MPKVNRELEETYLNISRPVVKDIAVQICKQLDLPKGFPVEFSGDNVGPLVHGSTLTGNDSARFEATSKLKINFKETPREDSWKRIRDYSQFTQPIFYDQKLRTSIYPVYDERKVEIGFTFRFKSRKEAVKTLNRIRNRIATLRKNFTHEAHYHYIVPDYILAVLFYIHQAREKQYGYGESLKEWINKHMTKQATVVSNANGSSTEFAIEELQVGIIGGLDESLVPAKEKGDEGITYMFTGTYTFNYNPPISLIAEYPQFVHAQPVHKAIRGIPGNQLRTKIECGYEMSHRFFLETHDKVSPGYVELPINIPSWDEWNQVEEGRTLRETRVLNCAISLSDPNNLEQDPYLILDLKELPYALSKASLEYIKTNPLDFNQVGKTPLLIELYQWDDRLDTESYYLTDDYCIKSKNILDRRQNYHIAITVVDLLEVTTETIEKVIKAPVFVNEILEMTKPDPIPVPELVPGVADPVILKEAIKAPPIKDKDNYQVWYVQHSIFETNLGL